MPDKTPLPTVRQLLTVNAKRLQPKSIVCQADRDLGWFEAEVLLAHALRRDRAWLIAHEDEPVRTASARRFKMFVTRRAKHEPVAYILGEKDFFGRTFRVSKWTLIPRPETELLVELAKTHVRSNEDVIILDVGTGSGAVAVTLAIELPQCDVIATDVSTKAIKVADGNAQRFEVDDRMRILKADLLDANVIRLIKRTHDASLIIVANLPYLPSSDKRKLEPDVVKFEPGNALFAGADGLAVITRFLKQLASSGLKPRASFLEFDPPQSKKLLALAKKLFPASRAKIHKDLAGRNRVLEISS
jgi:release factor glutamine methyltransferase